MASSFPVLVLRFTLPGSALPADVIAWIKQMLTAHSGLKVSIERASPVNGLDTYAVVSSDDADRVRLAWQCNSADWRDTGAKLCP